MSKGYAKVGIDIDLSIGDIRHPTSTSVIPISETNTSDWKMSFQYRKCSNSDIRYPTLKKKKYFTLQIQTLAPWKGKRVL
jgi:hypothetical protein